MFIDLIVIALLIVAIFKGLKKGFVVAVFSFLAYIIGLAAALKLSAVVANYIGSNINISERWLPFIAFSVVFLIVGFLVHLGAKAIEGSLHFVMLGWANKLGGVLLFSLIYFFILSIILFYAAQLKLLNETTIQASVVYPHIQPMAPAIINTAGDIIPFLKDVFTQLFNFFGNVADASTPSKPALQ